MKWVQNSNNPLAAILADPEEDTEAAPSVFTSPISGWFCIQNLFRRDDLVFIQILGMGRGRVEHGYTLNERDELNYWCKGPGGEIAFTPLQYELIIRPEELGLGSCKLRRSRWARLHSRVPALHLRDARSNI